MLLIAPAFALRPLVAWLDWRVLAGAFLFLSALTFFSYRSDKRRAEAGEWRISESILHLESLLGGWPAAFLAQRVFRHKISKVSFQFFFWSTVTIHQFLSIDSLLGWRFTGEAIRFIKSHAA
ncbi:MAG TPA: DUF1294 domain-containing protein [Opitutaceae bacterium]|nr:DUF1294 domain-containing protein [Opitutaceae bacterium]